MKPAWQIKLHNVVCGIQSCITSWIWAVLGLLECDFGVALQVKSKKIWVPTEWEISNCRDLILLGFNLQYRLQPESPPPRAFIAVYILQQK